MNANYQNENENNKQTENQPTSNHPPQTDPNSYDYQTARSEEEKYHSSQQFHPNELLDFENEDNEGNMPIRGRSETQNGAQNMQNQNKFEYQNENLENQFLTGNVGLRLPQDDFNRKNSTVLGGGNFSPPQEISINKKLEISVFQKSAQLDQKILTQLVSILSNQALKKEDELEFFDEMNLFDQEWTFPYNRNHFNFHEQIQAQNRQPQTPNHHSRKNSHFGENHITQIQNSDYENTSNRVEIFKRALVEAEMQLRILSDAFEAVNSERLFFRAQLSAFLSQKLETGIRQLNKFEDIVKEIFAADLISLKDQLSQAKADLKASQSGFVKLKQRNVALEEQNTRLKSSLAEKREQLKKLRFSRGGDKTEHHNTTKNTSNSNTFNQSNDNSYLSKDFRNKFTSHSQMGTRARAETHQPSSRAPAEK